MSGKKYNTTNNIKPITPIKSGFTFLSKKSKPPNPMTTPNKIESKWVIGRTHIAGWGRLLAININLIPLNKIKMKAAKINFVLNDDRTK